MATAADSDISEGTIPASLHKHASWRVPSLVRGNPWLVGLSLAGLLVFIAVVAIAYTLLSAQFTTIAMQRQGVTYSRALIDGLTTIERLDLEAHAGVRLYIESGNKTFLGALNDAKVLVPTRFKILDEVIRNPAGHQRLGQLRALIDSQLEFQRQLVATYDLEGAKSPNVASMMSASAGNVNRARSFIRVWRESEVAMLAARDKSEYQQLLRARAFALGSLVVGSSFILVMGWVLVRYIHRRDISERHLAFTSNLLNDTFSSVAQGIAVYDRHGCLMSCNKRYLELVGVSDPKAIRIGMSIDEVMALAVPLVGVDMAAMARRAKERLTVPAGAPDYGAEFVRADGLVTQLLVRSMRGDSSVVTMTDLTAVRHSERMARDQATRLSAIMDNVPDAIVTINASGSIESWSEGAHRLFGYTADEVVRRNVSMLMDEPYKVAHDSYIHRYLTSNDKRLLGRRSELEARHQDGHAFPIELAVSEMDIEGRRMFVGIIRDISERRAVERMKSEFVSTVSHELRTPLTSIAGSLGLLTHGISGALPLKAQRLLDIAHKNCERLTVLINDILDLEKSESGGLELKMHSQPLVNVLIHALDVNRAYAEQFGVRLHLQTDGNDPWVRVDDTRILQVLTNYLSNAAKFSPREGEVLVRMDTHGELVRVTVHDDGPGIPDAFRERIFTRFAQADSSDTRQKGGTGLGLAIAKSLVEHHGGSVGFNSGSSAVGQGQGASFWFELPVALVEPEYAAPANDRVSGRVLLCEDDPDIAGLLSMLLVQAGCSVTKLSTAQEARVAVQQQHFDLMLADIHLPDEDGLSLIATIRASAAGRNLPIIVISAADSTRAAGEMLASLQVLDWLRKPIDQKRLHAAVEIALRRHPGCAHVLHVEDDASVAATVQAALEGDVEVTTVATLSAAREALSVRHFAVIILDLQLPDGLGSSLLRDLPQLANQTPVILYSASEAGRELATAVQAALVKSRDSLSKLKDTIEGLIRSPLDQGHRHE